MKYFFSAVMLFLSVYATPQSPPQGINFQGVARNSSGLALSKQLISVEIKLFQGDPSSSGILVYSELHPSTPTDTFGLYNLIIGSTMSSGTGTFSTIPWSGANIWAQVLIDPTNGSSFALVSSSQLMSVPYALYSGSTSSGGISGTANNLPKINTTGNGLATSVVYENGGSVGIGNSNPASGAVLDVFSNGKGALLPRMTYVQRTSISTLHHGLTVFQVDNTGIFPEGYWYYDSVVVAWIYMAPAQAVWTLLGNYATNPASNFMGTMDDKDVVFKTGNTSFVSTERMRILGNTNGGSVQFGNSTLGNHYIFPPSKGSAGQFLQLDPGGSNKMLWTNPPGGGGLPTASIGALLWNNTGTSAGWVPTNTTSISTDGTNLGLGINPPGANIDILSVSPSFALNVVQTTTAGVAASFNNNNSSNSKPAVIVANAGSGNGMNVTASSGYGLYVNSGSGCGIYVTNSGISQPTIDAYSLLTANNAPALRATVPATSNANSAVFSGGTGMTTDNINITIGAAQDYILSSNASGKGTWVQSSINSGFSAYLTLSTSVPSNAASQIIFGGVEYNDATAYSSTSGKFTAPSAGVYHFDVSAYWLPPSTATGSTELRIVKNGASIAVCDLPSSFNFSSQTLSANLKLAANDIITIMVFQANGIAQTVMGSATGVETRFSGYRVY